MMCCGRWRNAWATAEDPMAEGRARRWGRGWRALACCLGVGTALVLLSLGILVGLLRASLPALEGRRVLPGLAGPASVERDALGVPTVRAANRVDAARALGFVHAQERFFQMDLLRRRGAGELAALFGPALVEVDVQVRRHGLRAMAREQVLGLPPPHRAVLEAYAAGVNAGLSALRVRPPEYLLLGQPPAPWAMEDSLLVADAMFFDLQDSEAEGDRRRGAIQRALTPAAAAFFFPAWSEWDAALDGSELPASPVPGPEDLDFRVAVPGGLAASRAGAPDLRGVGNREWLDRIAGRAWNDRVRVGDVPTPGSNSWGVQGAATRTGAAIVCNDMHLGHSMPNVWFRVCLIWKEPGGRERRVVGASLPGVPVPIVGSNGDIAWGFTNATLDNSDCLTVDVDPEDPDGYLVAGKKRRFQAATESLLVRGEAPRSFRRQWTEWGPVVGEDGPGRKRVVIWTPQLPGGVNLGLLDFESAGSVKEALDLAGTCGVPVQNLLVGDRHGSLAYTLIGRLPRRRGFDGQVPVSASEGTFTWDGWVPEEARPRWIAPEGGRLWTANHRILGTTGYLALGCQETDLGARARQIRDGLRSLPAPVAETHLWSLYGDDRAVFLGRWQELLLRVLTSSISSPGDPGLEPARQLQDLVAGWGGRAGTNSVGYRVVRAFRLGVHARLLEPALARCRAVDAAVGYGSARQEAPVWALLERKPVHLLNPRFPSYEALLTDAVAGVVEDLRRQGTPLPQATWGARNTVRIQHPISRAVPALRRWLDLEPRALPGDDHMPRVQGIGFGSSERMVVSPGHEETGLFQMPGGQSGHFLSPYYRAGHEDWAGVRPSPLLPGATVHRLWLSP